MAGDKPRTIIRVYMRALRARVRLVRRFNQEMDGLWLGLLDSDAIEEFDAIHYARTQEYFAGRKARYVDDDWNDQGLFPWEEQALADHFPRGGRIVVTSAGGGREVIGLLKAGYDAIGYEPNEELVRGGAELLESRGQGGRLHVSARDRYPDDAPDCDAIIVGWGSYTNMRPRASRVAFLRTVRERTPDGAPVLLSYMGRKPGDEEHERIARRAATIRRLLRRDPPEVGDALQPNFVHRFTQEEAHAEIREAGFEIVASSQAPYPHSVLKKSPAA